MFRDDDPAYTEGPVYGKCRRCDTVWCISADATDGWRRTCPSCGAEGDYELDPRGAQ